MTNRKKEARAIYIDRRARELAESGDHKDWMTIEIAIRHEGYAEVRQQLDNRDVREELDLICRAAQAKKKETKAR